MPSAGVTAAGTGVARAGGGGAGSGGGAGGGGSSVVTGTDAPAHARTGAMHAITERTRATDSALGMRPSEASSRGDGERDPLRNAKPSRQGRDEDDALLDVRPEDQAVA